MAAPWTEIISGGISLTLGTLAWSSAVRARRATAHTERIQNEMERRKVDGEAFTRAEEIYTRALKQLEEHNTQLEATIKTLRERNRKLQDQVDQLEHRVVVLEAVLKARGIEGVQ